MKKTPNMPEDEIHQHYLNATASDDSIYNSMLEGAVKEDGVCNIAVTGPYGSGKTTVINTFLQKNPQYKVLRISLAKLNKKGRALEKPEDSNSSPEEKSEDDLELCILQQMFYQAKGSDIPNSRFSRIIGLSKSKQIWYTVLIMLCILAFAWFKFSEIMSLKNLDISINDSAAAHANNIIEAISLFFIMVLIVGLYSLVRFLISKFSRMNIKQLVVDKLQLNVCNTNEQDALNKYLDEILYYFKKKPINIVVFEDLDRYNDPDIFIKLRELNTILNHSEDLEIKKKKKIIRQKITFIYALKDGIFGNDGEQLVKFFDYILPVVPYVNVSNSGDKMIQILHDHGYLEELGKNFINDFSPYIKDMRVIYNICNEYEVYYKIQGGLKAKNLMAMTVYKNLYPEEFDKIFRGEGTICEIFKLENKEAWQEERRKEIEAELPKIEEKIKEAQKEFLKDEKELKLIMIAAFIEVVNRNETCQPYGYNKISDLFSPEVYDKMIKGEFGYLYDNQRFGYYVPLTDIEKAVYPDFKYYATLQSIQNKRSRPEREKEKLQSELHALSRNTMEKMCENPEILKKLEDKTKDEPILYNFIRKGYINENYDLYISLFHEGDITQKEKEFIITVKKNQSTRDFSLSNVESIIKRLNDEDFNLIGTLNVQIADFLSAHYDEYEYKKKADGLFQQMETANRDTWNFLMDFIYQSNRIEKFLCLFIRKVPNAWKSYFDIALPPAPQVSFVFLNVIFRNANIDDIASFDGDKHYVAEYVNKQKNYDALFTNIDEKRIEKVLGKLPLCIKCLKACQNKTLNKHLIARNMYEITPENIEFVLQFDDLIPVDKIKLANYTTILASNNENLKKYIEDHFQEYLQNVFFGLPENTDESEDAILKIIQKDSLSVEDRVKVITQQKELRISDIQSIVILKEYWADIVPEHVLLNQKNFEAFYAVNGLCEAIGNWMKDISDVHSFLDSLTTISSTLIPYYTAVLEDSSITPAIFELLVSNDAVAKCLPLDLSEYDEEHLQAIAKSKVVTFSKEYYNQLLEYNDIIKIYVLNHIEEFIEKLKAGQIVMSAPLVYNLLREEKASEYSSFVISSMKDTDVNKENSVILADYYISHPTAELNKTILIPAITQCEDSIKKEVFIKMLAGRQEINKDEIFGIIASLGGPYSDIMSSKTPIRLPYSDYWYEIASILKSRGFIRDREHRSKTDYLSISKN